MSAHDRTREQFVQEALGMLDEGLIPAVNDLCERLGVTKGSFYAHFTKDEDGTGGARALHAEVITRWVQESGGESLAAVLGGVRDPLDRLRLLRARSLETVWRDGTMRRWAAHDTAARAAVAAADATVIGHVRRALEDMGFTAADAAVLAGTLVSAFAGANHFGHVLPMDRPRDFEVLLGIVSRAAAFGTGDLGEVDVVEGPASDQMLLVVRAPNLSPDDRREVRGLAQRFVRDRAAAQAAGEDGRNGAAEPAAVPAKAGRGSGA